MRIRSGFPAPRPEYESGLKWAPMNKVAQFAFAGSIDYNSTIPGWHETSSTTPIVWSRSGLGREVLAKKGFYPHRAVGGGRDHSNSGRAAITCSCQGKRQSATDHLFKQQEAVGTGVATVLHRR